MRTPLLASLWLLALAASAAGAAAGPIFSDATSGASSFIVPTSGLYDIVAIGVVGGAPLDAADLSRVVIVGFEAGDGLMTIALSTVPVPEPASLTLALVGAGLLGLGLARRAYRRR